MPKVSIIVPVYNAEKYLEQCITSLLRQTLHQIEIILVDDGSTDCSREICNRFAEIDRRIILLHQENKGAGAARRTGIEHTTSEYICFLDSDDYVCDTFCNRLLACAEKYDADLVECGYYVFKDNIFGEHHFFKEDKVLDREEFKANVIKRTIVGGTEAVVLWNKMYRKALIEQYVVEYGTNVLEDYMFNMQYYAGVQRYVYITEPLINYRRTENSLSKRKHESLFEILRSQVLPLKEEYMSVYGLQDEECRILHAEWYLSYIYNYLKSDVYRKDFFKRTKCILKEGSVRMAAGYIPHGALRYFIVNDKEIFAALKIFADGIIFSIKRALHPLKYKIMGRYNLFKDFFS